MIKASELRIGNLVYWNEPKKVGVQHRVIRIMENRINTVPISLGNSMEDYSPIPLSEGLLVAAGFTADQAFGEYEKTVVGCNIFISYSKNGSQFMPKRELKFVHELQNAWYVAYGKELSFDLSLVGAGLNQPTSSEAIRNAWWAHINNGKTWI